MAAAALALAALVSAAPESRAGDMGLLVPAYFAPGTGGTDGQTDGWAQMAASAGEVAITAIFNPDNGPAASAEPSYAAAIAALENAGGKVVAYVDTNRGGVPIGAVEAEIETYLSQYPNEIDGFFLDQMSTDPAKVSYYQQLFQFVQSLGSSYEVIGNPGVSPDQAYPTAANTLVIFEQSAAAYAGAAPPAWVADYPASTFGVLIHDQPSAPGMVADVALADDRHIGDVYVTDQSLSAPDGYLYDRLPSYWSEEVATVAAAAPEPGSIVLVAMGLTALAGATRLDRLAPKRRREGAA